MNFNPHSLNQILIRIREQMRCPQCGTKIGVDFPSVKLAGDDFVLLQLRCDTCNAFIVLHVNVTDGKFVMEEQADGALNASTNMRVSEHDLKQLRELIKASDGSFEKLFKSIAPAKQAPLPEQASGGKPDLPSAFA